jgi:hypothetical protein
VEGGSSVAFVDIKMVSKCDKFAFKCEKMAFGDGKWGIEGDRGGLRHVNGAFGGSKGALAPRDFAKKAAFIKKVDFEPKKLPLNLDFLRLFIGGCILKIRG